MRTGVWFLVVACLALLFAAVAIAWWDEIKGWWRR